MFAKSQDNKIFPEVNGEINYTEVVSLDSSIKKDELYYRAKKWFADTYKSANDVIQMQDKDAGTLIGKGIFVVQYILNFMGHADPADVSHTVKIYTKDGKYKYEITDFSDRYYTEEWLSVPINNKPPIGNKKNKLKFLTEVNAKVLELIESLKKAMGKPIAGKDF